MDFVGKEGVSSPDPRIPDTSGPKYSDFSPSLSRLSDGWPLVRAIAALDAPPAPPVFVSATATSTGYASLNLVCTRNQPLLVYGKVRRGGEYRFPLRFSKNVVINGATDGTGESGMQVRGTAFMSEYNTANHRYVNSGGGFLRHPADSDEVRLWTGQRMVFEILKGSTQVANASVLVSDSEASLFGVVASGTGAVNIRLAFNSGPAPSVQHTQLVVFGINSF